MSLIEKLEDRAKSYEQSGPSAHHTAELLREAKFEIENLREALQSQMAATIILMQRFGLDGQAVSDGTAQARKALHETSLLYGVPHAVEKCQLDATETPDNEVRSLQQSHDMIGSELTLQIKENIRLNKDVEAYVKLLDNQAQIVKHLQEALQFAIDGFDNQDVNHETYRIRVFRVARDAISKWCPAFAPPHPHETVGEWTTRVQGWPPSE